MVAGCTGHERLAPRWEMSAQPAQPTHHSNWSFPTYLAELSGMYITKNMTFCHRIEDIERMGTVVFVHNSGLGFWIFFSANPLAVPTFIE